MQLPKLRVSSATPPPPPPLNLGGRGVNFSKYCKNQAKITSFFARIFL